MELVRYEPEKYKTLGDEMVVQRTFAQGAPAAAVCPKTAKVLDRETGITGAGL